MYTNYNKNWGEKEAWPSLDLIAEHYVVSFLGSNPLRVPSTLALVSGKQSKGAGRGFTRPDSVTLIG